MFGGDEADARRWLARLRGHGHTVRLQSVAYREVTHRHWEEPVDVDA